MDRAARRRHGGRVILRAAGDGSGSLAPAARWAAAIGGAGVALLGLSRRPPAGVALSLAGVTLVALGVRGRAPRAGAFGIDDSGARRLPQAHRVSVRHRRGRQIRASVTIDRPAHELYRFWRNVENLASFVEQVKSVRVLGPTRSRWVVKLPAAGRVAWDAEIVREQENEFIAWRSLRHADLANAGSVHFRPAPGGRGTEVAIVLEYEPPAGPAGAAIAALAGDAPQQILRQALRRLKAKLETGEAPTVEGQPSGRRSGFLSGLVSGCFRDS